MPKNIDRQVDELYEMLKSGIELFPAGKRLPSTRSLLATHHCSRQTLVRALRRLEQEGSIRLLERNGIFVNVDGKRKVRQLLFVRVDWCSEQAERFSRKFGEEFARRPGYRFTELRYPPEQCWTFLERLRETTADVLIVWLEELSPIRFLKLLSRRKLPIILFASGLLLYGSSALDLQESTVGMLAARHLLDLGHRRVALLLSEPMKQTSFQIATGFRDYLNLHGIEPEIIDCHVRSGDASHSRTYDELYRRFSERAPGFTGCFALSDCSAISAMKALQDNGFRVPQDVSVIGCQCESAGEISDPPLTTVKFDTEKIASALADGIDDLFAGIPFGIRRVPPILVKRASTDQPFERN